MSTYTSSKRYFVIPIEAIEHFTLVDLYLVAGLYSCGQYNNENKAILTTDTTIEQLSSITGVSKYYIKDTFLPKLKSDGYVIYNCTQKSYNVKRNSYTLPNPAKNYRHIKSLIFKDTLLTPKEKGFIIGLYCLCFNNTFRVDLPTDKDVCKALRMSLNTYKKYKKALIEKHIIHKSEEAPEALRWEEDSTGVGLVLTYPHLGHISYNEIINEYDTISINTLPLNHNISLDVA